MTSFDSAQALVPPTRRRAASSPSPASHAVAAAAGTAPKAPICMTTQAGGYSESGRPLTARKALASPGVHAVAVYVTRRGQQRSRCPRRAGPGDGQQEPK